MRQNRQIRDQRRETLGQPRVRAVPCVAAAIGRQTNFTNQVEGERDVPVSRPRLLDLYSGQGGVGMGYARVGFEVVGVDINPMPRNPHEFHQADAFEYLAEHWQEFDCFHASPVCKGYSVMNNLPWLKGREYPLHILPIREAFEAIGKPYVIENVMGARYGAKGLAKRGLQAHGMQAGWLCGTMFGLPLYRHRLFETNFLWLQPGHPKHQNRIRSGASLAGRARDIVFAEGAPGSRGIHNQADLARHKTSLAARQQGSGAQKNGVGVGHAKGWRRAAEAMGVSWMDRDGTSQAIPPAYTFHVGTYLMEAVLAR